MSGRVTDAGTPPARPRLALTPGEPAGIGPDLVLALLASPATLPASLVIVADPELLAARAHELGLPAPSLAVADDPAELPTLLADHDRVCLRIALRAPVSAGRTDPRNAAYVLATLDAATALCQTGTVQGLVTGPVHKGVINAAGVPFTGHTEYLAQRAGVAQVVMMLANDHLRVALATTHLPLAHVAEAIDGPALTATLRILHTALRTHFDLPAPRIRVLGLNPHAGEDGHLGREELDIIAPVLDGLRAEGMALEGPLAADTAFAPADMDRYDCILAMYHDQGLPVLKHVGFGETVNITLGLPFVRTSVDHGTALELAGRGSARDTSLRQALATAAAMTRNGRR
ncbi:MAG TPA: 4-hydroxythreonine-4-phosphate dehydrogenase PdxA [Gammaproteobacteria bacterium]|nr:4-hydroxythreonine-4-phosphate dehydrogenase PdxA [Gammaproteobacteria bacterium]